MTIPSQLTSGTAELLFEPIEDAIDEEDETVVFSATAEGLGAGTATLRITDSGVSGGRENGQPSIKIWTDRPDYRSDQEIRLYLELDPRSDGRAYTVFFYRESIDTGERRYLAPGTGSMELRDDVVDQYGQDESTRRATGLERVAAQVIWKGRVPYPGLWHFVAEIRSPGTTQVLRKAYAKFVVPRNGYRRLNRRGTTRSIATDTRLTSDWVYFLGDRLFVERGATLEIDAGTLFKAQGPAAGIVVQPGGRIAVRGRREAPVVMTCSSSVGRRAPGCWSGLAVLGQAPAGAAPDGSGGPDDSSGELRYLRVEFAGSRAG